MTCSWCEERFERFLDGVLTAGERARLLAHVDACTACRGLLEELRVVDALLLAPRTVELPPNFTCATMADVRAMPPPCPLRTPLAASLIAYVVAAWSLVGAALLIAPNAVLGAARSALSFGSTVLAALTGLHALVNVNAMIIADLLVLLAVAVALRVSSRLMGRLRW